MEIYAQRKEEMKRRHRQERDNFQANYIKKKEELEKLLEQKKKRI